jgi:hypothetical protein
VLVDSLLIKLSKLLPLPSSSHLFHPSYLFFVSVTSQSLPSVADIPTAHFTVYLCLILKFLNVFILNCLRVILDFSMKRKMSTMSDTDEDIEQNGPVPDEQHCSGIEDESQEPESPGTQKLQHLRTTQTTTEDSDVSAKLVERPVSSGSTTFRAFTYGAPPKRDLHIPRKPTTAYCRAPGRELRGDLNASPPIGGVMVAAQIDNQVSDRRRLEKAFLVLYLVADKLLSAR